MAATVAATKARDLGGATDGTGVLREDLEDIIYDISPINYSVAFLY